MKHLRVLLLVVVGGVLAYWFFSDSAPPAVPETVRDTASVKPPTRVEPVSGLATTGSALAETRAVPARAAGEAPVTYGAAADADTRAQMVERLRQRSRAARADAHEFAAASGLPLQGVTAAGQTFALIRVTSGGLPVYNYTRTVWSDNSTRNFHAGISGNAEAIRSRPPFMMRTGVATLLGVWDGGHVLTNHVAFLDGDGASRVQLKDVAAEENFNDHATHVGGTMVAAGPNPRAQGMAPDALLWSYDWDEDTAEWLTAAMATASPTATNIVVSNHSYGPSPGWGSSENEEGEPIILWTGFATQGESFLFGKYTEESHAFDESIYAAPYTLPFFAAGNERTLSPATFGMEIGDTFFITDLDNYDPELEEPPALLPQTYQGPGHPDTLPDNDFKGGMNTISGVAVAKNVIAVGAVMPAYELTTRNPARAWMSDFSGWGPTDDGRIKPDLVSDGVQLLSVDVDDPEGYRFMTGTSMASPAAAGTAALLQDLYRSWFDEYLSAALLKALLIHTATDLGRPGPDYEYGWGLLDGQAAAEAIHGHFLTPDRYALTEDVLANRETNDYVVVWDGVSPLSATLAWTDPAPATNLIEELEGTLNATNRMLIHDLDLRIIGPDDTVYEPWILDPAQPANDASTGDNVLDNVEGIDALPTLSGEYRIRVTHKGELTSATQPYGLVVTGQRMTDGPRLRVLLERDGAEAVLGQGDRLYIGQTTELDGAVVTGRVANIGGAPLYLSGTGGPMSLHGDAAFSVWSQPASMLMPGTESPFAIRYQPGASGRVGARVEMVHNEVYQSPFFFDVLATSREGATGLPLSGVTELVVTQQVAGAGVVTDVNVTLGLSADYWEALVVELVSPSGVTNMVAILENMQAPDFSNVTFSARAAIPVEAPILSGAHYLFWDLDVQGVYEEAGDWTLSIRNHPDVGVPDLFSLHQFDLAVDWLSPQVILPAGAVFRESATDDGSIQNSMAIAVAGDTFAPDADQYVQVDHVPAGLTAAVALVDDRLEIELTGAAIHHDRFNSTANLVITLADGAFAGGNADAVLGVPLHGVMIDFIGDDGDPFVTTAPVAVPVAWLAGYGITSSLHAAVWLDPNDSRYATWQHYVMDTDPTQAGTALQFGHGTGLDGAGVALQWWGSSNRLYRVRGATNLAEGLTVPVADAWQPAASGWQTFTDTNRQSQILIYGVEVVMP
jgi:hypothetical protein